MNIHETFHFDKAGEVERFPRFRQYFLTLTIILVAILAFGVGRLTGESREGVKIEYKTIEDTPAQAQTNTQPNPTGDAAFASSQGTKYYYSYCKSTVSEKNKVTFATALMAEQAGYTLASTCKPR